MSGTDTTAATPGPSDARTRSSDPMVLACTDLGAVRGVLEAAGYRLDTLVPADDPRELWLSRGPDRIRLVRHDELDEHLPPPLWSPGIRPHTPRPRLEAPIVTRAGNEGVTGRAGMVYRDLVPGRLDGALIASLIRIDSEGPVPDYVHHHEVDAQLIFCRRGRVRVVYEGQGDPFVLEAGDAVWQAPGIRHRVLWASAGLEVVEVTAPAVHPTHRDHDTVLPDTPAPPDRRWGGQLFVHHVAADAPASASWLPGFETVDLGIARASGGRAGVRTHVATHTDTATAPVSHDADVVIFHVLTGTAEVDLGGRTEHLADGDTLTVGPGTPVGWRPRPGLRLLEVALPEHGAAGSAPAL